MKDTSRNGNRKRNQGGSAASRTQPISSRKSLGVQSPHHPKLGTGSIVPWREKLPKATGLHREDIGQFVFDSREIGLLVQVCQVTRLSFTQVVKVALLDLVEACENDSLYLGTLSEGGAL